MAMYVERLSKQGDQWRAVCTCGWKSVPTARFKAWALGRLHCHPMNAYITQSNNEYGTTKADWDIRNPSAILSKLIVYSKRNEVPLCQLNRREA